MRRTLIFALTFFILFAINNGLEIGANVNTVRILSVSTQIDVDNINRTGSIAGGTRVYIKIVGHDSSLASNNQVLIGPYECIIPDMGVNEVFISCITTPATDPALLSNLTVIVKTLNRSDSQCAQDDQNLCKFSYTSSSTPYQDAIIPRASPPSTRLFWFGVWKISNTNQIDKMLVEKQICDRFFLGLNEDTTFSGSNYNSLQCDIGGLTVGGYYDTSFLSKPGKAQKSSKITTVRSKTPNKSPYDVQIIPQITDISHSTASSQGAIVTIGAIGLPFETKDVKVDYNGTSCTVLSVDPAAKELVCSLPSGLLNPTTGTFKSSSGVKLEQFSTGMWNIDNAISDYHQSDKTKRVNKFYSSATLATTEIYDIQTYNSRQVYVFSGYFTAPRDGDYYFQTSCSYQSKVFIQQSGESTDPSSMTLLTSTVEGTDLRNPYSRKFDNQQTVSNKVSLSKDQTYYFEIFGLSSSSTSFYLSTGVRIPAENSSSLVVNSSGQVTRIRINYPFSKDKVSITFSDLSSSTAGNFKIYFIDPYGVKAVKTATYWQTPSTQFTKLSTCDQLSSHFNQYLNAPCTCQKVEILDPTGAIIGATWTLQFQNRRRQIKPTFIYDSTVSTAPQFTILVSQGANLQGSFKLYVNGDILSVNGQTSIPYNTQSYTINNALKNYLGTSNIDSSQLGAFEDGIDYVFDFYGVYSPIVIAASIGTLAGEPGVDITIDVKNLREQDSSLNYASIENDLLSLRSSTPSLIVTVNDVASMCLAISNCGITVFNDSVAPFYTGFSDDEQKKQITITGFTPALGSDTVDIPFTSFTVQQNGEILQTISYDKVQQTILAQYSQKISGVYKPIVDQKGYGVALSSNVIPANVSPVVTSISKNQIIGYGGALLVISGKYFPTEISKDLIVTLDGQVAPIQAVSNLSISVFTPLILSTGQVDVIVTYKTLLSSPSQILVDNSGAITLTSISSKVISPVEKTKVTLQGTNFGTNPSLLIAYLDEMDKTYNKVIAYAKYQINVISASTSSVDLLFGGGTSGYYRLRVVQVGIGSNNPNTTADKIEYNIYVTSLSRTTSSKYGGAILLIQGINFASLPSDNQVLVLYTPQDSELCIVSSSTSTLLTCALPDMSSHLNSQTDATFSIEVWGKLLVQALVSPSLKMSITFSESLVPTVTSLSSSAYYYGGSFVINGSNLPTDILKLSVYCLGYKSNPATVIISSGSVVTATVPQLESNIVYQLVLSTPEGNSKSFSFTISTILANVKSYTGISSGGQEISFSTSGMFQLYDPVFLFSTTAVQVLSYNPQTGITTIRLPPTQPGSKQLKYAQSDQLQLKSDGSYPWINHQNQFVVVAATWTITSKVTILDQVVSVTGTNISQLISAYLQVANQPKSIKYQSSNISKTSTTATITFSSAPSGSYQLFLLDSNSAYPSLSDPTFTQVVIKLKLPLSASPTPLITSFQGGLEFSISGSNFNSDDLALNSVKICGNNANIVSVTSSAIKVLAPPAYTEKSIAAYSFKYDDINQLQGFITFGDDTTSNSSLIGDGDLLFYYSSSNANSCYVGVDFGSSTQILLQKFELFPRSSKIVDASKLFGTLFQGSNDSTNWDTILTIGNDLHLGKNMYLIRTLITQKSLISIKPYQYFRLFDGTGLSKCELVEMKLYGFKTSSVVESNGILTCPISIQINGADIQTLTQTIQYSTAVTYIIDKVIPNYGDISGGTVININLDKAPSQSSVITVKIDGIDCGSLSLSDKIITCTTSSKTVGTSHPSLIVTIDGVHAVNNNVVFYYGNLWSNSATWGGDFAPIDGDLVYVSNGNLLIIDVPYIGVLNTVVVDKATLLFANDKDIHFEAENIIVKEGSVMIGTQGSPIQNSVRITMHGKEEDKQFPTIGNKGLSIYNGSLEIQGKERVVTWTELSETAEINQTFIKIKLKDTTGFDWIPNEEIVIASTDFTHGHAERRFIKSISKDLPTATATITFDQPLNVRHVSISETYNGNTIEMSAEIGLLTRNVVFEGDESSLTKSYGAHIMLHGTFTRARIRHAEFRRTGQPSIIGRYPIHFHMVGDASSSIVEGNAVHDSFARVLTIHATHYLHVLNNVGYNCAGHNIFLEDGIETNNIIEENLILGTKQVWSMLQSDITSASYWITNPLNYLINNRAGGSDFYGFWYEIKERPDGPSARGDICPQGMGLGSFIGNKAHSNDRFGLRIFILNQLKYPCEPNRDDKLPNPFSRNPSYQIVWNDFVSFRNHEDGVLAEKVGNMVFDNFKLLDNKQSGFNIYHTNRTDENVILKNSIIVGKTLGNPPTDGELINTRGVITPRTDGFELESVHFENFSNSMTILKSISGGFSVSIWVTGGKMTKFSKITTKNISSQKMVFWEKWRREIYDDVDGTLSGNAVHSWITPNQPHLKASPDCVTSESWDDGVICTKQVVRIEFSNPEILEEFKSTALFIQQTDNQGVAPGGNDPKDYYISKAVFIENKERDLENGFVGTFLTGQIYSVKWELLGIDFTHMSVQLSPYHLGKTPDDTIVIKFPYVDYRETYEIGKMVANSNILMYSNVTVSLVDHQDPTALQKIKNRDCSHGDWFNDVTNSALYLCLNQNGRDSGSVNQFLDRTDVNAIKCKENCPLPPGTCNKDSIIRSISNVSSWQNVKDIDTGEIINPTGSTTLMIPCPWTVTIDQDLTSFLKIEARGTLIIDPTKDINITVQGIYINGGTIKAQGQTQGSPYTRKLNIQLIGDRTIPTLFVIDNEVEVGNKVIVNTGTFSLIGNPPATTATRLTQPLLKGQNTINVQDSSGWVVGDEIAIGATQKDSTANESFIISSISGNLVTLTSSAAFYHYGAAASTISETWDQYTQQMDLRAQVLHLTRNIKISGNVISAQPKQWGCRVLNYYQIIETDKSGKILPDNEQTHLKGIVNWNGVEMVNCGQANSQRAALHFNLAPSDSQNRVSIVQNSAIHNCPGMCTNIESSDDITLNNNNYYNAKPIHLRIFQAKNLIITNNHFVSAQPRDYDYDSEGMVYDPVVGIYFYSQQDIVQDKVLIKNNYVQGSSGVGIALPHTLCDRVKDYSDTVGIYQNQAQTCLVGAIFTQVFSGCQWAGKIAVSRSSRGLMVNPTQVSVIVQHVISAESSIGVDLRFAHEGVDNAGEFKDSAIYGIAISNDSNAYTGANSSICSNNVGIQNLVVTQGGSSLPLKSVPTSFDVICNSEVFDSQSYQTNLKFVRFRQIYSDPNTQLCKNNFLMQTHPSASDATAGTYNNKVTCEDCDTKAYFNFLSPNPGWNGWFGGCGLFLCTGPENVLNIDFDGLLFNNIPTTAISHNSGIAQKNCILQSNWNSAYQCPGLNYAQLEWESQAPDHNKRSIAPVYVKSIDGSYTNKINMYREWRWDGGEPMNLRENRFVATILLNTVYTIEYNGLNPYDIYHRLQPRVQDEGGEPNNWLILHVTYQIPMNIEISIDNVGVVPSYYLVDNVDLTTKTSICGANIYDWNTRMVQYVITGARDCQVRAVVLDTVRIHMKVVIKVADFFKDNGGISFISKIASFLNIKDYSKIKIVGTLPSSSRFLATSNSDPSSEFSLVFDIVSRDNSAEKNSNQVFKQLNDYAQQIQTGLSTNAITGLQNSQYYFTSSTTYVGAGTNGQIYGSTTPVDQSNPDNSSESDSTLAIVLGVIISLVGLSIIAVSYCAYKRYKQRQHLLSLENELDKSGNSKAKETAKVVPFSASPAALENPIQAPIEKQTEVQNIENPVKETAQLV